MAPRWLTNSSRPPKPPYLVGFELPSGHVVRAAGADSLVLGQADLIRVATMLARLGVTSRVVLIHTLTNEVRERIVVDP